MSTRFKRHHIAAALALAAAIGLGARWVAGAQANPAPANPAPAAAPAAANRIHFRPDAPQLASLKIEALAAVALPLSEPVNGRVGYDENRTARVNSPLAGRVTALRAEPGDVVRPGAVLAVIDAPDLATAQADWRKARADEGRKRLAFERAQTLFDGQVLARKDFEAAQADYQQADAETRRAALRLRGLNADGQEGARFSLRAPIGGVVSDKQINPGMEVRPDLPGPLFVVTDLRHLWVMLDVPERAVGAIRAGQAVSVETDAYPGRRFAAKVERVGLALDPATHRVKVRCALDNPELLLKPEMFARVAFLSADPAARAVQLPNGSLFVEGKYDYVFVETRPGEFEKRRVRVALRGRDSSYADQGLAGGERVVTEGAFLLNAEVASNAR